MVYLISTEESKEREMRVKIIDYALHSKDKKLKSLS